MDQTTVPQEPDKNISYVLVTKDNYKTYLSDAVGLFHLYILFGKLEHTPEKCEEFLTRRFETDTNRFFICYYTPSSSPESNDSTTITQNPIPIGFCQVYPTWSSAGLEDNWHINDLYILEDYRSLKIGQKFILHIMKWADNGGAFKIYIDTTLANPVAQHLYPKLGFVEYTRFSSYISYLHKFERAQLKQYRTYFPTEKQE